MGKTPMRWLDVVKASSKKVAKGTGLKAILPIAKKEWALIKSCLLYTSPSPRD